MTVVPEPGWVLATVAVLVMWLAIWLCLALAGRLAARSLLRDVAPDWVAAGWLGLGLLIVFGLLWPLVWRASSLILVPFAAAAAIELWLSRPAGFSLDAARPILRNVGQPWALVLA